MGGIIAFSGESGLSSLVGLKEESFPCSHAIVGEHAVSLSLLTDPNSPDAEALQYGSLARSVQWRLPRSSLQPLLGGLAGVDSGTQAGLPQEEAGHATEVPR